MSSRQELVRAFVLLAVLMLTGAALYSNSAHHSFHLDDNHSITDNPALRSLHRVPDYFRDAHTFSTLLTNADYRPVLQLSYALNYAMAGYEMPVWHWTQVGIHVWCAFFLYLFSMELFKLCAVADRERVPTAVLASLCFLVHPTASGVVNYTSARSSELTAAFLLAAFWLDLRGRRWLALLFYAAAMFTKVEAVAGLAVFWGLSVLRQRRPLEPKPETPSSFLGAPLEWIPYLGVAAVYFVARRFAMDGIDLVGAAAGSLTHGKYLCTQVTAWWAYLYNWFCPLNLVADNMAYPIFSSPREPAVVLALVGWSLVTLLLWAAWKRSPHFAFLALSGLALISPTSSVIPLSEMMNEHRPYLPLALVSIIFVSGLVRLAAALPGKGWVAVALVTALWLGTLASLTWKRNQVFLTPDSYWADVVSKAPSGRAHSNFGLTLMKRGLMLEAQHQFEESLKLTPQYSVAHINLAIVYANTGRLKDAEREYDLGALYDQGAGEGQMWRGDYYLAHGEFKKAEQDFLYASTVSNDRFRFLAGLAQVYAGLGEPAKSAQNALAAGQIDMARFGAQIVSIATPYFGDAGQAEKGLLFFAQLERQWPEAWWIYANQVTLLQRLGRAKEAAAKQLRVDQLKPGPP